MQACRDVVREAVRRNGMALKFASKELRADRDMAELAVSKCGLALKFVAPPLRDVLEIVRLAVKSDTRAFMLASPECRAVPDFRREVLLTVKKSTERNQQVSSAVLGRSSTGVPPAKRAREAHRCREPMAEVEEMETAPRGSVPTVRNLVNID